ncbi:MAG: hypothetical protein KF795_00665 [Labilithrix sp.]|nr:hypothetical protein [Labilithrix sp.]
MGPYVDWREAHGLKTLDQEKAGWIGEYRGMAARACRRGEARACHAEQLLDDRLHPEKAAARQRAEGQQALLARAKVAAEKATQALSRCGCQDDPLFVNLVTRAKAAATYPNLANDERRVAECEALADQAARKAEEIATARDQREAANAARQARLAEERPKIEAAEKTCAAGIDACKKACAANDDYACVRVGIQLYETKRTPETLAKADELFRRACKEGTGPSYACDALGELNRREAAFAREAEDLWQSVAFTIDDISKLRHMNTVARTLPQTPSRVRATTAVDAEIPKRTKDTYCPARKAFVDHSGLQDFARRAKNKCDTDAAVVGIDSGIGEPKRMTAECRAVVASACTP